MFGIRRLLAREVILGRVWILRVLEDDALAPKGNRGLGIRIIGDGQTFLGIFANGSAIRIDVDTWGHFEKWIDVV